VPIDDTAHMQWTIFYDPAAPLSAEYRDRLMRGTSGDRDDFASDIGDEHDSWGQDRSLMKEGHWTGIVRSLPYEDFAVQEAMGPIQDRAREQLGTSDITIVRTRRLLLEAARAHAAGRPPFGQGQAVDHGRIRALAIRVGADQDWRRVDPLAPPPSLAAE
jgi:hypothetical protein